MTTIKLRYVQGFTDHNGHRRHYFRRPGYKRTTLPGLPGSEEFMAVYQAALAGLTAPKAQVGAERTKPGSMAALIAAYYESAEFAGLADLTKKTYRGVLERLRTEHGDKPVALLQPRHIRAMLDERAATPAAANSLRKHLRILMRFAIERDYRTDDPTLTVRKLKFKSVGFRPWTDADIAAFEARWPSGTRERLALALLLYTGQRRSDVIKFGRQHLRGDRLELRQQKTGTWLAIPIHRSLKAELDQVPATQMIFLLTKAGKPFSAGGFSNWFIDCAEMAGLDREGAGPHGLRKAIARRLAEAGCSVHQIMAITGHRSLGQVSTYTASAGQAQLAAAAMSAIDDA